MPKKKIVYLPLDERPCNYAFVGFLSENNAKYTLVCPPLEDLGKGKVPAKYKKIEAFLLKECQDADYLITALDMILYGGLFPSRLHYLSKEELGKRLALLNVLKANNPKLKIYAFSLVMRCPHYSKAGEEPDYFGICGREIFLYGQNEHKYMDGLISKEEYLATKESLKICEPYIPDFTSRREKNIHVFLDALEMVGGVIDEFAILQDDSAPYGYTALDQRKVRQMIERRGIDVEIYPGADEGGMTMLSSVITNMEGYSPKICPVYPDESCKNVIPLYEDREVYKSIRAQIKSAGATLCEDEEAADILLFCNLPVGKMQEITDLYGPAYTARNLPRYVEKMQAAQKAGKAVALADIAYSNGGDAETVDVITEKMGVLSLAGYAGWNTSSNTLGTVICQSVLYYFYGDTATHRRFTALRMYEDVGYCAYVREQIRTNELADMGYTFYQVDGQRGKVCKRVEEFLNEYMQAKYPEITDRYKIADCYLPCSRMFEVSLLIQEK